MVGANCSQKSSNVVLEAFQRRKRIWDQTPAPHIMVQAALISPVYSVDFKALSALNKCAAVTSSHGTHKNQCPTGWPMYIPLTEGTRERRRGCAAATRQPRVLQRSARRPVNISQLQTSSRWRLDGAACTQRCRQDEAQAQSRARMHEPYWGFLLLLLHLQPAREGRVPIQSSHISSGHAGRGFACTLQFI